MIITSEASLHFYSDILMDKLQSENKKGASFDLQKIKIAVELAWQHCLKKHQKAGWPCYSNSLLVARFVSDYTQDTEVAIAAILIDMAEDHMLEILDVVRTFGARTAQILNDLTFKHEHKNSSNLQIIDRLLNKHSRDAILIKLCSGIYNLQNMWTYDSYAQQIEIIKESKQLLRIAISIGYCDLACVMHRIIVREDLQARSQH